MARVNMMGTGADMVQIGEPVRIKRSGSWGIVQRVDAGLRLVRVAIPAAGVERWMSVQALQPTLPWYLREGR